MDFNMSLTYGVLGITQHLHVKDINSLMGTASYVQNTAGTPPVLPLLVSINNVLLHGTTVIVSRHPYL